MCVHVCKAAGKSKRNLQRILLIRFGFFLSFIFCHLQSDRIENDGYPAQVHKIVTSDGYILQLHRIGNDTSLSTADVESRVPVFLMHGLLETASSWIALGPEHSLGTYIYSIRIHALFNKTYFPAPIFKCVLN